MSKKISENFLSYKIVQTVKCGIRDEDTTRIGWFMEENLYIITNGAGYGIIYDQKSRCFPAVPPQYDILLDCEWDRLSIIDTENGAYVVAYSKKTARLFYLLGNKQIIEENNETHKNLFSVKASTIS